MEVIKQPAWNCPKHGKQESVLSFAGEYFCWECLAEFVKKYIKPLEEIKDDDTKLSRSDEMC